MRHFGVFVGINSIYADLSCNNEDVEAALFGPMAGIELRF